MLFVHSNSNLHEKKCLFFLGSIRTQPAPDPSKVLDPSKKSVQKSPITTVRESTSTFTAKPIILQSISSAYENQRRSS